MTRSRYWSASSTRSGLFCAAACGAGGASRWCAAFAEDGVGLIADGAGLALRTGGCVEEPPPPGDTLEPVPGASPAAWSGPPDAIAGAGTDGAPSGTAAPSVGAESLARGAVVGARSGLPVGSPTGASVAPLPATGGCPELGAAASVGADPLVGASLGASLVAAEEPEGGSSMRSFGGTADGAAALTCTVGSMPARCGSPRHASGAV